ncbi:MAG TPA: VWA domain-containing protein [Azospira sp.]|nr:VWA domain-containing protein [Azospira sp.]
MEEFVGKLWHNWITRAAGNTYPGAAVRLKEMERTLGILFRAFGGDPGLRVAPATEESHGARRKLLARIAGSDQKHTPARLDAATLRLPSEIAAFPERELNKDLYLWLAALAAASGEAEIRALPDAFSRNQAAARRVLATWPGLAPRYERLVQAHLAQRLLVSSLPAAERPREEALRQALLAPGTVAVLPPSPVASRPVLLWLDRFDGPAAEPRPLSQATPDNPEDSEPKAPGEEQEISAHRAERVDMPKEKNGLLMMFRAESLFSWGEFVKVNRPTDEDPEHDPTAAARDLDYLSLAQDGERVASKVRFDLDLPSTAEDDVILGDGIALPEWDYRKGVLLEDHVRLLEMSPKDATPAPLPPRLARTAKRLHQQFAALMPARRWLKGQPDGAELDVDAYVRAQADRAGGGHPTDNVYLSLEQQERDLACLVLADLSLSTDAWVSNEARVVDVVRDTLLLFGEALAATGDRFALCGFSSLKRSQVRFSRLKDFGQKFDAAARGRVLAIKPGYYTRLGAAIRHASKQLEQQAASRRVLLILSDGKPNDLDLYDGRYGIEDTRMAIIEARKRGLQPFCVTIDREGESYLPHLFGPAGYAVIRRPEELPQRLPLLYAQLTR